MTYRLLRFISLALLLFFAAPEVQGQKKTKRRSSVARHSNHPNTHPDQKVDIKAPGPAPVPIPQERSLRPKMEKTKKVVIVPAPPPPPGKDPMPPYPKR